MATSDDVEHRSVYIILKDRLAPVTSRCDVIDRAREFDAEWMGHKPQLREARWWLKFKT